MYDSDIKKSWQFRKWIVSRSSIVEIIFILGIIIWMNVIVRQNNQCQNSLKPLQALQFFRQIDDLGHEWITDSRKRWSMYNSWLWIEKFEQIDADFHATSDIDEKFKLAKEMDMLMERIDVYMHKIWGITTAEDIARDKKFHEIDDLFRQVQ